ncbi:MAG: c-type cytochrome [Leptolyngbyaceae bacterium]|nr:c-type cytochrome [Leptolyngbyaceae bacterium]
MNRRKQQILSVILGLVSGLWSLGWMPPCMADPISGIAIATPALSEVTVSEVSPSVLPLEVAEAMSVAGGETGSAAAPTLGKEVGAEIFEVHCAGCHVNGGNIIRRGKNLKMRALQRNHMDTVEAIAHIVTVGKRPMSAYADKLTPEEIEAVSVYVLDQAQHDWK